MALINLIKNQSIIIDDHKHGNRELKDWDDKNTDIHIDKKTYFPVNGKKQQIRIRIPINSERPIRIENWMRKELDSIPNQLKREIQSAFENKQKRERFINDIVIHLKNFDTILKDEERVQDVLSNISKHFELNWTNEKIAIYTNNALSSYTQRYIDENQREYFITVDKKKIEIGEKVAQ